MVLPLHIDEYSQEVTVKLDDLRKLFLATGQGGAPPDVARQCNISPEAARVKLLEATIEEAILELEKTKTSFKSQKIKEVRENLKGVLVSQRHALTKTVKAQVAEEQMHNRGNTGETKRAG